MKFPDLNNTTNMSSEKSHISNNRLYTHNPSLSGWTYNIDSLIPQQHWKFSEPNDSNSHAQDSGLNPKKIEKQGNTSLGNSGKIYYSADFPGSNGDYFYVSHTSETVSEITVSLWLYNRDITKDIIFLQHYDSGQKTQFRITSNVLKVYWNGTTVTGPNIGSSNNEWTHLTITHDLSKMKFYINGILKSTISNSLTSFTSSRFYIGQYSGGGYTLNGKIEDLRIYNRVLNAQEIAIIYNYGNGTTQQSIPTGFPTAKRPNNHVKCQDLDTEKSDSGILPVDSWWGSGTTTSSSFNNKKCYYDSTNKSLQRSPCSAYNTLIFWYMSKNNTNDSYIIEGNGASSGGYFDLKIVGSNLYFYWGGSSTSISVPSANKWHFVIITTIGETAYLYIDTEYKTSVTTSAPGCPSTFYFLKNNFDGYIQDIRTYDYKLNINEILNLYNNGYGTLL